MRVRFASYRERQNVHQGTDRACPRCMPRLPRFFAPGYPFHVIQRGNNRTAIFRGADDRTRYLELLLEAIENHDVHLHAYALMSNHVHLLATPQHGLSLSRTMQDVGRSYVLWFNRKYRRTGTLWEGRYRATVVDSECYVVVCMKYIELNAVRAALVNDPGAYEWSSYRRNALGEPNELIVAHGVYLSLGHDEPSRRAAYRRFFSVPVGDGDLQAIREATNLSWALGDEGFRCRIQTETGRRAAPLRHGPNRQWVVPAPPERQPGLSLGGVGV
jgi:putative transposase